MTEKHKSRVTLWFMRMLEKQECQREGQVERKKKVGIIGSRTRSGK